MNKVLIGNIQRFSLQDGSGIRTTCFLMGCNLKCPWCANPENKDFKPHLQYLEKKCVISNGNCFLWENCPVVKGKTIFEENVVSNCPTNAISYYGEYYDDCDLYEELIKDRYYQENGGGVTFSGGEPLLQAASLVGVLKRLKRNNINICFETCLNVPHKNVEMIIEYVDYFYVDIKLAIKDRFKNVLGGNLDLFKKNLALTKSNNKNVVFRFPVVPGITDDEENIKEIIKIAKKFDVKDIELFSVHNLAESKYKNMNKPFTRFEEATSDELSHINEHFILNGLKSRIGRF